MTERFSIKKPVLSALFAAPVCMATMSIRILTPGTGGYIHPGDAIVILCGMSLGLISVFLAVGIGSCMADLLGGYFIYVSITSAIKGLTASSASHVCRSLRVRGISPYAAAAGCGVIDIALVAGGYCMCEALLYGLGAALVSVPSNTIQGTSGLIISNALYPVFQKPPSMTLKA